MNIISRRDWGARPPSRRTLSVAAWKRKLFIVHYSDGRPSQTVRAIQDWCMNPPPHGMGFADIDYNFLVRGTDGAVYEGRGWDVIGAHAKGYNTIGIGVCVITDGPISDAAKAAVAQLYAEACKRSGRVLTVKGHRDVGKTECPGDEIYQWVRGALEHLPKPPAGRLLKLTSPFMRGADVEAVQRIVGVKVDGVYGPLTTAAVKRWQFAHKLDADGIVGPLTRAAMHI